MSSGAKLFNEDFGEFATAKYVSFSQEEFGLHVQFQYNDLHSIIKILTYLLGVVFSWVVILDI